MSQLPIIELARLRDAGNIACMSRDLIEAGLPWTWRDERVARAIGSSDVNVAVARRDNTLTGFCIMEFGDTRAHMCLLGVRARFQRNGIGAALTRWQEKVAITAGLTSVHLELRAGNVDALRFYERLGFERVGSHERYYSQREDAIVMRHALRQAAGSAADG